MNREELLIQEKQHYEALACEETVLKEESSSLAESDAAKLKDQEIKLTQSLMKSGRKREKKKAQEQEKKEKHLDAKERLRQENERNETIWADMEGCLDEMEDIPFDEFSFLRKELLEDRNPSYSFSSHNALLKKIYRQGGRRKRGAYGGKKLSGSI